MSSPCHDYETLHIPENSRAKMWNTNSCITLCTTRNNEQPITTNLYIVVHTQFIHNAFSRRICFEMSHCFCLVDLKMTNLVNTLIHSWHKTETIGSPQNSVFFHEQNGRECNCEGADFRWYWLHENIGTSWKILPFLQV